MRHRSIRCLRALVVIALALTFTGCSKKTPTAPVTSTDLTGAAAMTARAGASTDTPGPRHYDGRTGPGSVYSLDVPAGWNGDLVVYAHGITLPPQLPIALPNVAPLRDALLAQGFAVAMSSFDENGYALKDGVQRTHQLTGLFTARFGQPRRVYLLGVSLGGIIALDLAETHPQQYAGVMTVSGVMGGTRAELDYVATVRVLFDLFYPHVLPGSLYDMPPITDFNAQVKNPIITAVMTNPNGAMAIAGLMGGKLPARDATELVTSLVNVLGFQVLGANDLVDRTHGHSFFDNAQVRYQGPLPTAVLDFVNANVARYTSTPDAIAYLEHYYEPSGDLRIPLLAIHNERDPQVPSMHEIRYAALVGAHGASEHLLQRCPDSYGHCNFSIAEIVAQFHEMTVWVETGAKPAY